MAIRTIQRLDTQSYRTYDRRQRILCQWLPPQLSISHGTISHIKEYSMDMRVHLSRCLTECPLISTLHIHRQDTLHAYEDVDDATHEIALTLERRFNNITRLLLSVRSCINESKQCQLTIYSPVQWDAIYRPPSEQGLPTNAHATHAWYSIRHN